MKHILRKAFALLVAALMLFALTACTPTEKPEDNGGDGPETILIGYALNKLDDAGTRQMAAFQTAIDETNAARDDIQIEFTMTDAQSDVDKQIADVESLVAMDCDIIIVSCVDTEGSKPALQYAKENGVMTVEVRGMESEYIDLSFVGVDEYALSVMWVDYLREQLAADPALVLNVGLVYGKAGQTLQLLRHKAIKELAEEMPDRVKIAVESFCDWDTNIAMSTVEDWMQSYPELNCIAVASDEMCVGVTNALSSANVNYDEWIVLSCDGTANGIQMVADGKVDCDIKQIYSRRFGLLLEMTLAKYEGTLTENYYNAGSLALVPLTLENFEEYAEMN